MHVLIANCRFFSDVLQAGKRFPEDIFYISFPLLERSTHLKEELGGGSLTAVAYC
jgi:F0F1-type ATP synthase alpha subunit